MADLKAAMKAKDTLTRDTLRMIRSDLGKAALDGDLDEAAEIAVLQKAVKTRAESAKQYDEGERADLADKERAEIEVIQRYLPKPMGEDEARAAMKAIAEAEGITEKKQMGQLIKLAKEKHSGRIDGRLAAKIAGSLLS